MHALPDSDAALIVERERVKERERELAAHAHAARESRADAERLRALVEQQRDELLRARYDMKGFICVMLFLFALLWAVYVLAIRYLNIRMRHFI